MRIDLLTTPGDEAASHSLECESPAALRHWLMQDNSGISWLVAIHHGGDRPVLVIGARAGYVTVRGGWDIPMADVEMLWGYITRAMQSEQAVDEFLDGMRDFTRRAVYPGAKEVK